MDPILLMLIVALLISMFSSWLIGRQVFVVMNKRENKWANTASLFTAMISMVGIFILICFAISHSGGFRR